MKKLFVLTFFLAAFLLNAGAQQIRTTQIKLTTTGTTTLTGSNGELFVGNLHIFSGTGASIRSGTGYAIEELNGSGTNTTITSGTFINGVRTGGTNAGVTVETGTHSGGYYISPGINGATISGTTKTSGTNDFVLNPNTKQWPTTIIIGDSTSTSDYSTGWPAQLSALSDFNGASLINTAVSGRRVDTMLSVFNAEVKPHLPATIGGPVLVNFLGGNNDFGQGRTAAQVMADVQSIVNDVHSGGGKISVMTVLPSSNPAISSSFETNRQAYNSALLSGSSGADLVFDAANVQGVNITGTTTITGTDYYTLSNYVDGTHPDTTGNGYIAAAYRAAILGSHLIDIPKIGLNAGSSYTTPMGNGTIMTPQTLSMALATLSMHEYVYGLDLGGDVSTGSGSHGSTLGLFRMQTGTTAASAQAHYFNTGTWLATTPLSASGDAIDFSKQINCSTRFFFNAALSGSASFQVTIGKSNGNGALNSQGFGFLITYQSSGVGNVALLTYDSSLHTSATLGTMSVAASVPHEINCLSDGLGTVYLFVDGSYLGSASGGPTANNTSGKYVVAEIFNGNDTTNNDVYLNYTRVVSGR